MACKSLPDRASVAAARYDPIRAASDAPRCPDCSGIMAVRHRRSDGNPFWGCTRFPKCRGTRNI